MRDASLARYRYQDLLLQYRDGYWLSGVRYWIHCKTASSQQPLFRPRVQDERCGSDVRTCVLRCWYLLHPKGTIGIWRKHLLHQRLTLTAHMSYLRIELQPAETIDVHNCLHLLVCLPAVLGNSPSKYGSRTLTFRSDVFSIVLQAIGGGIASASPNTSVLEVGDNFLITGLSIQVATMLAFGALAADYAFAVRRNSANLNPETTRLRDSLRFKLFLVALWVSYLCVLIRCCYR